MGIIVLLSIATLLITLVKTSIRPATAFTVLAAIYLLFDLVPINTFLQGYTNSALATLVLLILISGVLEKSPLFHRMAEFLLHRSEAQSRLRIVTSSALLSAFLNNTAVVSSLLNSIMRQRHVAPSRLLIPLSYASVLGGITTLVGTSTNLVVNSFAVNAGLEEFSMFSFAWVGIPVALLCLAGILLISHFLPNHQQEITEEQSYFLTAELDKDSPMVGHDIETNQLRKLDGLFLLELERQGKLISPVHPDEVLAAGDILIFTGEITKVQTLQRFPGLSVLGERVDDLMGSNLLEAVVTSDADIANSTLQEIDFRAMFDAGVVGIRRGNKRLQGQLGRIPIRVGDCLLLAVGHDFSNNRAVDRNFHLLSERSQSAQLSLTASIIVIGGFLTTIVASGIGLLPLFKGLLLLLGICLVSGLTTTTELRNRFPFELVMVIGSALAIAYGVEHSAAAGLIADFFKEYVSSVDVYIAFISIFFLTLLLTETVTNNAAAALAFPIALSIANSFDADPTPFILAVAYGASACFLIPFGYQTHLMVFSPGRYRVSDFIQAGLPISVLYSVSVLILTPIVFPFF
ncbi:SLC13 family permease [Marinomonas piezotolerans]|uniref:SLC13 family permease n=1 Tax=Marinomonas piezotolerans TaxID=2213058 RepID=A0A370U8H0_9GAMM|nr:SLC13 family permease [Marinomonas piezotolerans]RDL44028.1 SLC13 family permease [Marinomonas piezotolerans]